MNYAKSNFRADGGTGQVFVSGFTLNTIAVD
jgi:hypothetical protein